MLYIKSDYIQNVDYMLYYTLEDSPCQQLRLEHTYVVKAGFLNPPFPPKVYPEPDSQPCKPKTVQITVPWMCYLKILSKTKVFMGKKERCKS